MKRLRKQGVIGSEGLYVTISAEQHGYWLDAEPKVAKKTLPLIDEEAASCALAFIEPFSQFDYKPQFIASLADWEQVIQNHAAKMLRANYTPQDVDDFWHEVICEWTCFKLKVIEKFSIQVFADLFTKAEYHTAMNRGKGEFRGKNSLGLLKAWAKTVCADCWPDSTTLAPRPSGITCPNSPTYSIGRQGEQGAV